MATGRYTPISSYDLTVGVIVDMDEAIYMVSPTDSPFLTGVDSDGLSVLSSVPTNERKVEWMHDGILTPRSALAATAISTAATITVTTGDGYKFDEGDLVLIDSEMMRIGAIYATTTDILSVTRGDPYGTTAQHLTGHAVVGVGHVLPEGSDPGLAKATDRTAYYNVTQIFGPIQVDMSGTEQVVAKYGVPNEFNHQLFQRTQELAIRREQAILYGQRIEDDSAKRRAMGGIFSYITSNVSSATELNVTTIAVEQQNCWDAGGMPDRLATNPVNLTDLNQLADTGRVRMDFTDTKRGREPVMSVITEFGQLMVVRNRWIRRGGNTATTGGPGDALLFKRDQTVRRPLRPLLLEKLAKTGDSDQMQLVCEESLEVKGQQHMAKFTALTYS